MCRRRNPAEKKAPRRSRRFPALDGDQLYFVSERFLQRVGGLQLQFGHPFLIVLVNDRFRITREFGDHCNRHTGFQEDSDESVTETVWRGFLFEPALPVLLRQLKSL